VEPTEIFEAAVAVDKEAVKIVSKISADAVVDANVILLNGLQELNLQFFGIAKISLEKNAEATKQLFTCKSPKKFFALQNYLAKSSYDHVVVDFQKISKLSVKVVEASVAPISKQLNAAVEKISKQLATQSVIRSANTTKRWVRVPSGSSTRLLLSRYCWAKLQALWGTVRRLGHVDKCSVPTYSFRKVILSSAATLSQGGNLSCQSRVSR